ncbi:polysaccharide pyruvyl transferase family protein [Myceligenerans cantabricum]
MRHDAAGGRRLVDNFGDLLAPMLVERMLWRHQPRDASDRSSRRRLFVSGSVLHHAQASDVVWGAGFDGKVLLDRYPSAFPAIDVRAVRGPWTARLLTGLGIDVPAVFGDPALLLPRLLPELGAWAHSPVTDTLVVPNAHDLDDHRDSEHTVLDPRRPVHTVLRAIARSRFVVGSSLHAVILADALGIPARFVASPTEPAFKYRDYLAGTGRPATRIARDVSEAHHLGGHEPADADLDALEDAFPWDLWGIPRVDRADSTSYVLDDVQDAWRDRVVAGDGSTARTAFLEQDLPRLRTAVTAHSPEGETLVASAADLLTHVIPDVLDEPLDSATRHLINTILRRDAGLVATAAHLEEAAALAALHATRPAGRYTLLSLTLRLPGTVGDTDVALVLTGTGSGRTVTRPVRLFGQARKQWHVTTDVLVPLSELGEDSWTVEVHIGDLRLPVRHARAGELALSAPATGREPRLGEPVVVASDGTVRHEEDDAA